MSDLATFERLARETIASLPPPFRSEAQKLVIRVEDWPPADMLREMGIEDPLELTGLYDGVPLTERSFADPSPFPDTVWLFREPILDELTERGDETLERLVAHVTVHEVAHHFGWSDDDIAAIDRWWE